MLGDVNSIENPAIDTWGGTHVRREACLAQQLLDMDFVDAFRTRHPR